jgi:toxin secretion/phage lysis holin
MNFFSAIATSCKEVVTPIVENFWLKSIFASAGFAAGILFGVDFFRFVVIVVALVVIDGAMGIWNAYHRSELSPRDLIRTVPKLIRYLVFIVAGNFLAQVVPFQTGIENVIIVFVSVTEFLSIARNLNKLGMPLPQKLVNTLSELRNTQ